MLVNRLKNMSKSSAIFYLLLGFTLFLIIYPVSFLIFGSFWSGNPGGDGNLTLDNYRTVFSDPKTFELLRNSVAYALGSAFIGVSIATGLSFITTRTNAPLRQYFVFIPILLPLFFYFFMIVFHLINKRRRFEFCALININYLSIY